MRPPISQHDIYANRISEEGMFAAHQNASPPPHMNNLPNGMLLFLMLIDIAII